MNTQNDKEYLFKLINNSNILDPDVILQKEGSDCFWNIFGESFIYLNRLPSEIIFKLLKNYSIINPEDNPCMKFYLMMKEKHFYLFQEDEDLKIDKISLIMEKSKTKFIGINKFKFQRLILTPPGISITCTLAFSYFLNYIRNNKLSQIGDQIKFYKSSYIFNRKNIVHSNYIDILLSYFSMITQLKNQYLGFLIYMNCDKLFLQAIICTFFELLIIRYTLLTEEEKETNQINLSTDQLILFENFIKIYSSTKDILSVSMDCQILLMRSFIFSLIKYIFKIEVNLYIIDEENSVGIFIR